MDQSFDVLLAAGRGIAKRRDDSRKGGPQELLSRVAPDKCRITGAAPKANDTNRIRFDFKKSAFVVWYEDENAKPHHCSKGFTVPRLDVLGNLMSSELYGAAKAGVLKKAREAWNDLDQSDLPRFDID